MPRFTIADCSFLLYGKTAALGQDNKDRAPTNFEWEYADPANSRFITDGYIPLSGNGVGQVAWLLEPFLMHPHYYFETVKRSFDFVLTHNKNMVHNYGWLWYPFGGSYVDFDLWGIRKKSAGVSLILSNKQWMPGQKLRHEILRDYDGAFDGVFGLDIPIRKFDGLADFHYSVVTENERSSSWFTEKLIDCFALGTMPIYWGCPDIGLYFDTRGMIIIEKLSDLSAALEQATPLYYKACLPAIKSNLEIAKEYRIPEDWIFEHYPFLFEKDRKNDA